MSDGIPIIIVVIAGILVALTLVALTLVALRAWAKQKEGKSEQLVIRNKKAFFTQLIIGLILVLTASFFMFDGDSLGENTTGIATVVGIVGICLIAASNVTSLRFKRK